jgi:hypothetical protein
MTTYIHTYVFYERRRAWKMKCTREELRREKRGKSEKRE